MALIPVRVPRRLRAVAAMPPLTSTAADNTVRLSLMALTVSGRTESRVANKNTPPSTMSVSLRGPAALRLSSSLMRSIFDGSTCASTPSAWDSSCAGVTGMSVRSRVITSPAVRNGPVSDPAEKSRYCSPAGDSPETRTTADAGTRTPPSTFTTALTPVPVKVNESTEPIRTPCSVTSWLGSSPPDSASWMVSG
ncbi:Uncharacterised protein [Mycobacteroides abscessus subsp. abscessus]|nr:Uncharacterised protein [Mycobacteroides abscessus subsp. abscessus]SLI45981.1 Uncharacterised protein [Mycobacteroides abscessus subsp. abscessus]SLJ33428.1 Uncharacterised protein [Mycobacteroides abscessus subsp. abscessus]